MIIADCAIWTGAEIMCPVTRWQRFKLVLRTRWPRVFGRLAVRHTPKDVLRSLGWTVTP